ncbi:ribbon-helix-helix domain-containing protein [Candidatus Palauibacter sp.]|uniref:ribbon-helix-helix domain-containing protein n=1 Tax=Candidatus Palauibacter sp. TaxID=3101350 RepID=UPI003B5B5377
MDTMNISLPASLRSFADEQVADRGFETCGAYIRELIRHDRDRQHLRSLLLEGGESAPEVKADASYFESLRVGVRRAPKV